jgi:hypothetical protein
MLESNNLYDIILKNSNKDYLYIIYNIRVLMIEAE